MKMVEKITATDLRDFLKGNGWATLPAAIEDGLYVLENSNFERRQLVFPIQKSAVDFVESTTNVIRKFSELSGMTTEAIVQRVLHVRNDSIRLRVQSNRDDTSLPLGYASELVGSVEKLIKSAACTVMNPRVVHPRLSHREALQMVGHTHFGQTEVGSFVMNVSCPINALDVQGAMELTEMDAPFVRKVFNTMGTGVRQLINAVEADTLDDLVDTLKGSANPVISSNMCEAVSSMHDASLQNAVELNFMWSTTRPINDSLLLRPIRIQEEYFSRIEDVRKELRSEEIQSAESYIGTVERLDGDMGEDGSRSGPVLMVLLLSDEDETVRANVSLTAEQYSKAIRAHETNGAYVRVRGRLRAGRQPRSLTELSEFELLN
ncbi:hypothetical protein [Sulfitobacter geojensis]|uniref:hypothetical protein n=1 Tax=Sulfitobacter geojensis TaxID=1342299 RepID=UPI003B8D27E7